MAQSFEKIISRVKRLEKELMVRKVEIQPEDALHFLEGTKAEREQEQAAIMKRLEGKYPDVSLDDVSFLFIHYVDAKEGRPVDPADALVR